MAKNVHPQKKREEILKLSSALFAKAGYDGVSMRTIASAAGVTPAALYYHFHGKEQLYLDAVSYAFKDKLGLLEGIFDGDETPWVRLESFITRFTQTLAQEEDFQRLMQWILIDSDEQRLHKLTTNVFEELFVSIFDIAVEIGQDYDAHLLTFSIISLIHFPFQARKISRALPSYQLKHENPTILAQHVMKLLRNGLVE